MKKIARIIQSGRNNPTFYLSRDPVEGIKVAVEEWEDTDMETVGNRPECEAYEVWLVSIDEEDRDWSDVEALEVGVYHKPPLAERAACEGDYVYQPLLTGKRMQVHKEGAAVRAFDHKGRRLSGDVEIGETTASLSRTFLSIASMDVPEKAIFDTVMLAEDCSLVFTDILRYDDYAAHEMNALARMRLLAGAIPENEKMVCAEWSLEAEAETIARPVDEGYFSDWIVVGEQDGRGKNQGDQPGSGPGGKCVCPECGYEEDHDTDKPCNEKECPECGATMTRKD